MANEIFVDSGAWLALADSADDLHAKARSTFTHLLRNNHRLVTTNLVIAETYNLIRCRVGYDGALRFLRSTRSSPRLERIFSNATIERDAEMLLVRFADQDFSYVDAVSFEVMRARGILQAFAFDHHFLINGFVLIPS